MDIVFMRTPDFAVPSLQALCKSSDFKVAAVFTQPDKPVGRKRILTPPPVKAATPKCIPIYQPATLKDEAVVSCLREINPDLIVVVAYGKILPKSVLSIPKYGCVNIHGSLLPKYRGAAPIQRAVIDGEAVTGVTSMLMSEGLDTGDILLWEEVPILPDETSGELFDRLSAVGADLLVRTIGKLEQGELTPIQQDDTKSTYAAMLSKDEAPIDFTDSAAAVHNKVRGMNPWPIATAVLTADGKAFLANGEDTAAAGKKIKVYRTRVLNTETSLAAGTVLCTSPLTVACGRGAVELAQVQPEGGKRMAGEAFARGYVK